MKQVRRKLRILRSPYYGGQFYLNTYTNQIQMRSNQCEID